MACGTGKTLVALWAVEQLQPKTVLVLVPSLTLLQQTLDEWSRHHSWGNAFSYICVCSDPTVASKDVNDPITFHRADADFRVDTDPTEVRHSAKTSVKVLFSTYQSSDVVSQAMRGLRAPWLSPEERRVLEEQRRVEEQRRLQEAETRRQAEEEERQAIEAEKREQEERQLQEIEAKRRADEEERQRVAEAKRQAEAERLRKEAEHAEQKQRENKEKERQEQAAMEVWGTRKPDEAQRIRRGWEERFKARTEDKTSSEQDADVERTAAENLTVASIVNAEQKGEEESPSWMQIIGMFIGIIIFLAIVGGIIILGIFSLFGRL
jgi:hypothetical protein